MTLVFAHRGSKGTHPENTIPAFEEAIRVKVDGIELDVQLTKDGEMVVIHDGDVERTTNGNGLIKDLTLKEVKELDAGSWFDSSFENERIPLFSEVLALLEDKKYPGILNIEIKTDEYDYEGIELKIINCLKEFDLACNLVFSSFNTETMERMMSLDNVVSKAMIMDHSVRKINFANSHDSISAIHPSIEWVKQNKEFISSFEKKIRPWTANTEEDMALCFNLNLDGFHTDFPEKAMAEKEKY